MVLYRKYRPDTLSLVRGQDHITKTLSNALRADKLSHAYIFTGPKGTGKTTIARILAKGANCLKLVKGDPCNVCKNCKEINDSRSLDIIEIDGASNRGIEEIRDLREGIKFSPNTLRFKVFIIDEVHMLTTPAFNALLKTLEEPPSHALFVLATTEPHKVLSTIMSRCQRFDFKKLGFSEIVKLLSEVSKKEKIKIDLGALKLLAVVSEGDMRDAFSLLDQLIAQGGGKITLSLAQKVLGISDIQSLVKFADLISKKDSGKAMELVEKVTSEGIDMNYYIKNLMNYFRTMMVLKLNPNLRELVAPELTDIEFKTIISQGKGFRESKLIKIIESLIVAKERLRISPIQQLPLEMAIVELCG